jgi:hypothetical protein
MVLSSCLPPAAAAAAAAPGDGRVAAIASLAASPLVRRLLRSCRMSMVPLVGLYLHPHEKNRLPRTAASVSERARPP